MSARHTASYRATLLLAGLVLLSGSVVAAQLSRFTSAPEVSREAAGEVARGARAVLPRSPQLPALRDLQQTRARPLFRSSRRPPLPEDLPAPPTAAPVALAFDLTGIVAFDGRRIALLKPRGPQRVRRLSLGQRLDGWRVVEIGARHVVLEGGAGRRTLSLKSSPGSGGRDGT